MQTSLAAYLLDETTSLRTSPAGGKAVPRGSGIAIASGDDVMQVFGVVRAQAQRIQLRIDKPEWLLAHSCLCLIGQRQPAGPHGSDKAGSPIQIRGAGNGCNSRGWPGDVKTFACLRHL